MFGCTWLLSFLGPRVLVLMAAGTVPLVLARSLMRMLMEPDTVLQMEAASGSLDRVDRLSIRRSVCASARVGRGRRTGDDECRD